MSANVLAYLLDIGTLLGILAGIGAIYIAVLGGLGWLLSRRWGRGLFRTLWRSIILCIAAVVIAISLFIGIAGLYRYGPPGDNVFGLGMQRQDWQVYASVARIAFFGLCGLLVVLGGVIGFLRARRINQGKTGGITASLAVLFYLIVTMPIVDFFNACMIGAPFLLPASC